MDIKPKGSVDVNLSHEVPAKSIDKPAPAMLGGYPGADSSEARRPSIPRRSLLELPPDLANQSRSQIVAVLNELTSSLTNAKGEALIPHDEKLQALSEARKTIPHADDWRGAHYWLSKLFGGDYHQVVDANRSFKWALDNARTRTTQAAENINRAEAEEAPAGRIRTIANTFHVDPSDIRRIQQATNDLEFRLSASAQISNGNKKTQELQSIGQTTRELMAELDPNGSIQRAQILQTRGDSTELNKIKNSTDPEAWNFYMRLDDLARKL